jgi:hypothetical protein
MRTISVLLFSGHLAAEARTVLAGLSGILRIPRSSAQAAFFEKRRPNFTTVVECLLDRHSPPKRKAVAQHVWP